MKLQLYKINERYAFSVGRFHSPQHFFLCADIKPTYKYAWEAYRDANNLYRKNFIHIDTIHRHAEDDLAVKDLASETPELSAEEMIVRHYKKIYELMILRCESFKDESERDIVYGEIKSVVAGMLKIKEELEEGKDKKRIEEVIGKFRKIVRSKFQDLLEKDRVEMAKKEAPPPDQGLNEEDILNGAQQPQTPQPQDAAAQETLPITPNAQHEIDSIIRYAATLDKDVKKEVMDEYAERICSVIEKDHPDSICKINYESGVLRVTTASGEPMLRIVVNEHCNVCDIEPGGELSKSHPFYSLEFYQKYWKPIVEKIGHYLIRDLGILISSSKYSLPDIPNKTPISVKLSGWNVKDKAERPFEISFSGDKPIWKFKKVDFVKEANHSKYTEDDFIRGQPRRVTCIDPNIKSLSGKIGEVKRVIPLEDHLEIEIDFGRNIVRLTENQIELLNDEIPSVP